MGKRETPGLVAGKHDMGGLLKYESGDRNHRTDASNRANGPGRQVLPIHHRGVKLKFAVPIRKRTQSDGEILWVEFGSAKAALERLNQV